MDSLKLTSQNAILEAGFEVFSANSSASISDVAARAGVGRATLHRYYPSRNDLLLALAKQAMDELDEAVTAATTNAPSYTEGLRLALYAVLPLAQRQLFLATVPIEADADLAARYSADVQETHDAVKAAQAEGGFVQSIPTEWIVQAYEHLIYAGWAMVAKGEATPKHAAKLAWNTLTKGMAK